MIKDLVVDMSYFWNALEAVEPYVNTKEHFIEQECLQTPEERLRIDQSSNCIMCGACYSECNALTVNPNLVGPPALAKIQRMIVDSRDTETEARLKTYNDGTKGVWGCTHCHFCNTVCPMDVSPMDQIAYLKQEILARKNSQDSRAIRHRKVLIDLVKQGGWIDERKFGLFVVGNYLRYLKGLFSLTPLGLRMFASGKFTLSFKPSEGANEVR